MTYTPWMTRFALLCMLTAMMSIAYAQTSPRPVLVELYTSEGCSSCPPADDLLAELAREQPVTGAEVIPLAFHVDYFNSPAWRDRFSDRDYTRRQQRYALVLPDGAVYTPQMVVGGRRGFLGSDRKQAISAIVAAVQGARMPVKLSLTPGASGERLSLRVETGALPEGIDRAVVFIVIAEDGLRSNVQGGENGGRRLRHDAVVRWFARIGAIDSGDSDFSGRAPLRLRDEWVPNRLRIVAFVQDTSSLAVLGAASKRVLPREQSASALEATVLNTRTTDEEY